MSEEKQVKYPAQAKYRTKVIRKFTVDVNRNTEPDVLAHLEKQTNVTKYIKGLIRADMAAKK